MRIVGVSRSELSDSDFRQRLYEGVETYARRKPGICERRPTFRNQIEYLAGGYDDAQTYGRLAEQLAHYDAESGTEGIHLRFEAKQPGTGMKTRSVNMEFHYARDFGVEALPEAYERLLLDAMQGDASLFARADEIELAWALIDPILGRWETSDTPPLAFYEPGSWGPAEADELLEDEIRTWVHGCGEHR
jgi:glucose-6-phosphate 1-dehydrogenase